MGCPATPKVNRSLVPVKGAYFLMRAGAGSLMLYIVVFMKQKGLTPAESAIICGASPVLSAPLLTAVGLLSDKLNKHRLVLMVCLLLTSVFTGCMVLVPSVEPAPDVTHIPVDMFCSPNGSFLRYCSTEGSDHSSCLQTYWEKMVSDKDAADLDGNGTNRECHVSCEANLRSFAMPLYISSDTDMVQIYLTNITHISFHLDSLFVKNEYDINSSNSRNDTCGSHTTDFELHNISVFQDDSAAQLALIHSHMSCASASSVTCQLTCPEVFRSFNCKVTRVPFNRTFFVFALLFFLGQMFFEAGSSLLDACTYSQLGDEHHKWSLQRLWGTIGYALFGVTAGFVMDAVSENHGAIDYTWAFGLYVIHNLLAVVAVFFYKGSDNVHVSHSFAKVFKLIRNADVACLLLVSLVLGMINGVTQVFYFWHLETLGASHLLLGLCGMMSCLLELLSLFFAGPLIKLVGEPVCFYLVCFAFAVQFLAYSFVRNPWWAMAIEPVTGFTDAMLHATATSHGNRLTPPGMHGLMQGLVGAATFGVGKGLGSLVAGPVFELYDAAITFQVCAVSGVVTFALYLPAQLWLSRRARRRSKQAKEAEDASVEEKKMIPYPDLAVYPNISEEKDASVEGTKMIPDQDLAVHPNGRDDTHI